MKKPLLKVYITAPYFDPFNVEFVSNKVMIFDKNNKAYKTNIIYKYIFESVKDIIFDINVNFLNYKLLYYFNGKKVKNDLWMDN